MIDDIILREEWKEMEAEGLKVILKLTRENVDKAKAQGCLTGRIDKAFLEQEIQDRKQHFYLC